MATPDSTVSRSTTANSKLTWGYDLTAAGPLSSVSILIGIESKVIIEPHLSISMVAFYFFIVPWRFGSNPLVCNIQLVAESIQRMYPPVLLCIGEFSAIVRLNHIRHIAKIKDGTLYEVHCGITAVLSICVDKPFSDGLLQHGILVEFFTICFHITGRRHIFHIHLPF